MDWLSLTLLSVLFSSIAGILQKVLMKDDKSNPYSYTIVFLFLINILSLPFTLFHGFKAPELSFTIVLYILSAILWSAATLFFFKALKYIEASEGTILSSSRVLVIIIASIVFLGERFDIYRLIGTVLVLVSLVLVTHLKKGIRFNKGVLFALVTAATSGAAIVIDSYNLRTYDAISYYIVVNVLMMVVLILIYPKVFKEWKPFLKSDFLKKMVPLAIVSIFQSLLYTLSLVTPGITAQASVIRQTTVIVTVILAVVFLNERDHLWRKLAAAVLVTGGVILLS